MTDRWLVVGVVVGCGGGVGGGGGVGAVVWFVL